jgi:acetolactate synthase-1/2/3 large subunit
VNVSEVMVQYLTARGHRREAAQSDATGGVLHRRRGLAMVQGELRLAASLGLDLLVVVFCDGSLNRIEIKQANRNYPSWGTLIEPTDLARLAPAMGCEGVMVDSSAALGRLLAGERPKDRPLVVGARIDPSQYTAQF